MIFHPRRRCYLFITFVIFIFWYVLDFEVKSSSKFQPHSDVQRPRYFLDLLNSSGIFGKEFNFDNKTFYAAKEILNTQTFRNKPVIIKSYASVPQFVPVTAASSHHFKESLLHLTAISRFFPHVKLVYFDIGLENRQVERLKNTSFVDYRKFDFARFPEHVRELYTYAWKTLVIQEMLMEFGAIMWLDASIQLVGNFRPGIEQMVKEKSGFLFIAQHGKNSILGAAHPNMLEYFPLIFQNGIMQQSGAMMIVNTPEVQRDIMKWAVLCSLEQRCIAPLGSQLRCPTLSTLAQHFLGCHRFDQAMFNVLVANAYKSQSKRYAIQPEIQFAETDRRGGLSNDGKTKRMADRRSRAAYKKRFSE